MCDRSVRIGLCGQGEKLWEVVKEDPERCGALVSACAGLVMLLAGLVQPFMPATSARIAAQLALPEADTALRVTEAFASAPHRILPHGALFPYCGMALGVRRFCL